jgi:hypothetical protein
MNGAWNDVWVRWNGSSVRHLAHRGTSIHDVRVGGFPLECGRWAPDGWDDEIWLELRGVRACVRCSKAADRRREREES